MARNAYIAGVGMTRFGKRPEASFKQLAGLAAREALGEARIQVDEVDAVYFANAVAGSIVGQEMIAGQVALRSQIELSGTPLVNVENACASASTALHLAWQSVTTGVADVVLCVGVEKMSHPDKERSLAAISTAVDVEELARQASERTAGRSYFMDLYAEEARKYMEQTDATPHDFAAVAAKNHTNGIRNPLAQFGSQLTADQVLAAREIVWPLTLPMCSRICDGAAAAVVMSERRLNGCAPAKVRIIGSAMSSGVLPGDARGSASSWAAHQAYEQASIGPGDLDVVEVHDATAPAELFLYESLELAKPGDAAALVREGRVQLGGKLPVNTSGGLLAQGHPVGATGLAQVHELTFQLQERAGDRQVDGAILGMAHNAGGILGGDNAVAVVHILERVT